MCNDQNVRGAVFPQAPSLLGALGVTASALCSCQALGLPGIEGAGSQDTLACAFLFYFGSFYCNQFDLQSSVKSKQD